MENANLEQLMRTYREFEIREERRTLGLSAAECAAIVDPDADAAHATWQWIVSGCGGSTFRALASYQAFLRRIGT